jgi:broad specificity phosphatase PhoE
VLILVRHGRTAHNASGLLQGRVDNPLDEAGWAQAAALARVITPARVVASPLVRARQTAEAFGTAVEVDERWIELDYGQLDGQPIASVPADTWRRWRADPDFAPAGGESLVDVSRRVTAACEDLVASAADSDVVVVSHVSPIKAAVAWALGADPAITWRLRLAVASVCRVDVSGSPVLVSFNEVHHSG